MNNTGALVYVVDDDPSAREGVARLIRSAGLMAKTFASGEAFLAAPRTDAKVPSCLVLDVNLPGVSGIDVQQELAKSEVELPIVFLTGHGDIPMTVRAVKAGAANFLTKPCDDEELLNAVRQCIKSYETGRLCLESEMHSEGSFEEMIGDSPVWLRLLHQVTTVAPTGAGVLLLGETGTGKELIARAIHSRSQRRERTLVKLSCAAVPTTLLESELFGHEKGAFTGALTRQIGRFELAHKGTLFLDEVGDIPLELQTKLLRALQEEEFERLGNPHTIKVDVRVIAATNRDLSQMVKDRTFRQDLYYRLNVFPILVPPLRERSGDIELLVRHFVAKYAARMHKPIQSVPAATMKVLREYHWPGNVRELEHFIERAVILSPGNVLQAPVEELLAGTTGIKIPTLEEAEREQILQALRACNGVIGGPEGAAARLAINRSTLNSRMRKLGISRGVNWEIQSKANAIPA
jgi:DNA-binding NtrC family response regulator